MISLLGQMSWSSTDSISCFGAHKGKRTQWKSEACFVPTLTISRADKPQSLDFLPQHPSTHMCVKMSAILRSFLGPSSSNLMQEALLMLYCNGPAVLGRPLSYGSFYVSQLPSTLLPSYKLRSKETTHRIAEFRAAKQEFPFVGTSKMQIQKWLWLKNMYLNGTLVNGTKDSDLRNPSSLILSHTQIR